MVLGGLEAYDVFDVVVVVPKALQAFISTTFHHGQRASRRIAEGVLGVCIISEDSPLHWIRCMPW